MWTSPSPSSFFFVVLLKIFLISQKFLSYSTKPESLFWKAMLWIIFWLTSLSHSDKHRPNFVHCLSYYAYWVLTSLRTHGIGEYWGFFNQQQSIFPTGLARLEDTPFSYILAACGKGQSNLDYCNLTFNWITNDICSDKKIMW